MSTNPTTSPIPLLARLFWAMAGPLIFILFCLANLRSGGGWISFVDLGSLIVIAGMILARWLEFRGGDPRTATGEPATQLHFRRYAWAVLASGLALWAISNVIANRWQAP